MQCERLPVQRTVIELSSGAVACNQCRRGEDESIGHKDVVDDDGLATGTAHAGRVPVVVDGEFACWNQEVVVGGSTRIFDQPAHDHPVRMIDTTGEPVPAGQAVAAVDLLHLGSRCERCSDPGVRTVLPDSLLGR